MLVGCACRYKVVGWLKGKFPNPKQAEAHYIGHNHKGVQTDVPFQSAGDGEAPVRPLACCTSVRTSVSQQIGVDEDYMKGKLCLWYL